MNRDEKSQEILTRYAAGERNFSGLDCDDFTYDFSDCDLRGAIFSASFFFADFTNANLEGADFSHGNVKTSDFSRANLKGATFEGSAIDAVIFDGADLTNAQFEGASDQGQILGKDELPRSYVIHRTKFR